MIRAELVSGAHVELVLSRSPSGPISKTPGLIDHRGSWFCNARNARRFCLFSFSLRKPFLQPLGMGRLCAFPSSVEAPPPP